MLSYGAFDVFLGSSRATLDLAGCGKCVRRHRLSHALLRTRHKTSHTSALLHGRLTCARHEMRLVGQVYSEDLPSKMTVADLESSQKVRAGRVLWINQNGLCHNAPPFRYKGASPPRSQPRTPPDLFCHLVAAFPLAQLVLDGLLDGFVDAG